MAHSPITIPFEDLPGVDPAWSRFIQVEDADGIRRSFHFLDSMAAGSETARLTIVCVHGNPTWSYLWRNLLALAPSDVRVIAVDQLGMGYSERLEQPRILAQRIDDLTRFVGALNIDTPIVSIAHDWGGPISLGWVESELRCDPSRIEGVILLNTAVHQPEAFKGPGIIRLARARALLSPVTEKTNIFVRGTTALSFKRIPKGVQKAFAAPYSMSSRRTSVQDFVADIPFESDHPSRSTLDSVAHGLDLLIETPVLLCWGPKDPVFSDLYLRDFKERLPHAQVHRYEGASHLVSEDAPNLFPDVLSWISDLGREQKISSQNSNASHLVDLSAQMRFTASKFPHKAALVVQGKSSDSLTVTWSTLNVRTAEFSAGLAAAGVKSGDRIALLIPPGPELIALIYATWNIGACIVLADSGLGLRGMIRALKGSHPDHIIGIPKSLPIMRALQIPGLRLTTRKLSSLRGGAVLIKDTAHSGDLLGAVVFTSGSTGPAKGVRYTRSKIQETVNVLLRQYKLTDNDVIVAAFAPWVVFGPALGIASVLPEMDSSVPSSLTFDNLVRAVNRARGTLLWASPAALTNVVKTSGQSDTRHVDVSTLRLVLSAGAPVPRSLLIQVAELFPTASIRTPYGMTEALPLTDISLDEIMSSESDHGVPVGMPVSGVEIGIAPLSDPTEFSIQPEIVGEIVIRAPHMRSGYDNLHFTTMSADLFPEWHRTGDVGHLDPDGSLWVEGRISHLVRTSTGVTTPVPIEQRVESIDGISQAACVGVGPDDAQVVVVVVVCEKKWSELELHEAVRTASGIPVAAVLVTKSLPMDIRHNAKLNREKISQWASKKLSGAQ